MEGPFADKSNSTSFYHRKNELLWRVSHKISVFFHWNVDPFVASGLPLGTQSGKSRRSRPWFPFGPPCCGKKSAPINESHHLMSQWLKFPCLPLSQFTINPLLTSSQIIQWVKTPGTLLITLKDSWYMILKWMCIPHVGDNRLWPITERRFSR